jgi:hypothetical protein
MKINLQALLSLWIEQNFDSTNIALKNNWTSLIFELSRPDSGIDKLEIKFYERRPILDEYSRVSIVVRFESLWTDLQLENYRNSQPKEEFGEDDFFDGSWLESVESEPEGELIWDFKLNVSYPEFYDDMISFIETERYEVDVSKYNDARLYFRREIIDWSFESPSSALVSEDLVDDNGHIHINDWSPMDAGNIDCEVHATISELDIKKISKREQDFMGLQGHGKAIIDLVNETNTIKKEMNSLQGKLDMVKRDKQLNLSSAITDEEKLKQWLVD